MATIDSAAGTLTTDNGVYRAERVSRRFGGEYDVILSYRALDEAAADRRFSGYRSSAHGWRRLNEGWRHFHVACRTVGLVQNYASLEDADLIQLLNVAVRKSEAAGPTTRWTAT